MSNSTDRRVKRTRKALAQALIALSVERGYASVSIRDITVRAGVGYATFFRHYPDKAALLNDVLDVFLEELTNLLQPAGGGDMTIDGELLFSYVREHQELCRVLLGSRSPAALAQQIRRMSQAQPPPAADQPLVPPELAENHIISATIALIQWWFDHNMAYSPARMGQIYSELIIRPAYALVVRPLASASGET